MSSSDAPTNMARKIEVVDYDPKWTELFKSEAELLKQALGCNCVEIHHIGSTSIPGLRAKPIIDMLPVVRNIQEVDKAIEAMESLGYEAKGEYGMAFRRYFQKGKNTRTHHVHVYQEGDPEISRYLKFRDWMRSHKADAENYAKLKLELAKKFPHDILQYCNGKDAFVATIDAKDGFDGWRMVKALTDREWDAVRLLRQKYFFKSKEDPYTWTFTHKDHIHFVFYKKAEIIGYAHLQLWPDNRAALRIIAIDEHYRKLGFGSQFLRLCERWLYHQGIRKILIQSSPEAYKFYRQHGYREMPFNDPDGYDGDPQDIEIGKDLILDRMDRPKISVYIATSIDGYIARKDGGLDFLDRVGGFDEDYGFQKLLNSIDALIIGRKTYEVSTTVPDPYPGKRVVVLTNRLHSVRKDMELYQGDLTALLTKLHKEGVKHIWVDGGVTISQFLDLQTVDSMTLSLIPVILGSGIPLFNPTSKEHAFGWMPEKVNDWRGGEAPLGYSWKKSEDASGNPIQELQAGPYAQKIGRTFQEVVLALAKMGHHIVVDDVSFGKQQLDEWKKTLKGFRVLWVGVNAPLSVLEQREKERGNRILGSARGQFHKVHVDASYDLEIDTHQASISENVEKIMSLALCPSNLIEAPTKNLIRPMNAHDIAKIVSRYSFPWSTPEKTKALWDTYYQEQEDNIRTVAIIETKGEILGYGSLLRKPECPFFAQRNIPEINAIWIGEDHRRKGLGTALIKWLESLASQEGYHEIGIGVGLYRDYGPAQQLYFQLGYVPDGNGITYKGQPTVAGQSYPLDDDLILWMVKPLSNAKGSR